MAPALIGQNPLEISRIHEIMDRELKGHNYAKSPIDMALWDIFGKVPNWVYLFYIGSVL